MFRTGGSVFRKSLLVTPWYERDSACQVIANIAASVVGETIAPSYPAHETLLRAVRAPSTSAAAVPLQSCEVRVLLLFGESLPTEGAAFRTA